MRTELHIDSVRNKFGLLVAIVKNNIEISISETKVDSRQFHFCDYSELYKFNRNGNKGAVLLYIGEDIPSKLILNKMTKETFQTKRRGLTVGYVIGKDL